MVPCCSVNVHSEKQHYVRVLELFIGGRVIVKEYRLIEKTWFLVVMCLTMPYLGLVFVWMVKKPRNVILRKVLSCYLVIISLCAFGLMVVGYQTGYKDMTISQNGIEIHEDEEEKESKTTEKEDNIQEDIKESEEEKKRKKVYQKLMNCEGKNLNKVYMIIQKNDYSATYINDTNGMNRDITDDVNLGDEDYNKQYIITEIKVSSFEDMATIKCVTKSSIEQEKKKEELEEVLGSSEAWLAVRHYGENEYPYGFKLHLFTGLIAEEPNDGEWFLKANVTITNAFNAKYDTVVEARVSGTSANPVIDYFFVY